MPEFRPALMTVNGAAEQIGCHPETIRRAIRTGRLACYRMRGCTRIAPEHLQAYLDASLCPARDQQDHDSNSTAANGTSRGGREMSVSDFRQARRIRAALDRPSRISSGSSNDGL
jgi:excisionase family DNA binding protein